MGRFQCTLLFVLQFEKERSPLLRDLLLCLKEMMTDFRSEITGEEGREEREGGGKWREGEEGGRWKVEGGRREKEGGKKRRGR